MAKIARKLPMDFAILFAKYNLAGLVSNIASNTAEM